MISSRISQTSTNQKHREPYFNQYNNTIKSDFPVQIECMKMLFPRDNK